MRKEAVTSCFRQYNCCVGIIPFHKVATRFAIRLHLQTNIPLQTALLAVHGLFWNLIKHRDINEWRVIKYFKTVTRICPIFHWDLSYFSVSIWCHCQVYFSWFEVHTTKFNFKNCWGQYIPSTIFVYAYRTCFVVTVECALFLPATFPQ